MGSEIQTEPSRRAPIRRREAAESPLRFFAYSSLLWFAAAACTASLYFSIESTAWFDVALPRSARLGLLGTEITWLFYPSVFLGLPLFFLLSSRRSSLTRPALVWVLVWFAALGYAASWLTFRSTGHFLDSVTLRLWWKNSALIAQHASHMEPFIVLTLLAGAAAFAAGVTALLVWARRFWVDRAAWVVVGLAGLLLITSAALPMVARFSAVGGVYSARASDATGPLAHLAADLKFRFRANSDPVFRSVKPRSTQTPILALADYRSSAPAPSSRANVLLVVVESLRPDQLLAFGGHRVVMPTVEAMADSGRVFVRHYSQASHSDYADPTLLSSHYPLRSSTYHIYPESPSYPRVLTYDVLASYGYRIGIFSSQNESWGGMKYYLDTGNVDEFLHSETYDGPTYVPERDAAFAAWARSSRKSGKIDDRFTVNEAIDWIEEGADPFFIYLNLQNSHVPYVIPADFEPPFGTGHVSFPIRFGYFPADSVAAVKDLYASSLAYVDAQLSRLVDALKAKGIWDETIVVLTGDTGQAFYEHGFTSHASALYDEVMRVPLIIGGPGIEPGREEGLSQHIDVPPTVLGMLGLPSHPSFQGQDLFTAQTQGSERSAFLLGQALVQQYAIVRGPWKLIYDATDERYELYDLLRDPFELNDVSEHQPLTVNDLALALHAWRKVQLEYYGDPTAYTRWYPPLVIEPESIVLPEAGTPSVGSRHSRTEAVVVR